MAYLIARKYPNRRGLILSIPVLVFIALSAFTKFFVIPPLHLWKAQKEVESFLLQITAYEIIAKHDPKAYTQIRHEIHSSLKNRETRDETISRARILLTELVSGYISRASDESILRYMKAMVKEMEELAGQNPDLCYQFLFPQRYGALDVAEHVTPEAQREDLEALGEVIRTAVEQSQSPPDSSAAEASLKKFLNQFAQVRGEDTLLLKDPFAPGIDKGKVCSLIASLYKEVLKLPPKESSLLLRYMLSAKKQ